MYKIILSEHFRKQLKHLLKKDIHIISSLEKCLGDFEKNCGILIRKNVYKIRLARDNSGKSSGYRMYLLLLEVDNILSPVCIYRRNEKGVLTSKELQFHIDKVQFELDHRNI